MTGKYIITMIVTWIPELLFCWIAEKIFDLSMWYIFMGLQIVWFSLWIIRTVVGFLLFHLVWKNGDIDSTYCSLVEHHYPNPQKYFGSPIPEYKKHFTFSGSDYFSDVMWDDEIEIKTRLDAAQAYGTFQGLARQGILEHLRMEKVISRAVEKYHKVNFSGGDYQRNPDEDED